MRLAHLGPAGSFGEQAALLYAPVGDLLPLPSHAAVAAAVLSGEADEGLLAVENSLEGSVTESLDLLLHDPRLHARAEVVLPIELCLIVPPGRTVAEVRVILSHTNPLGQSRGYIERCFPEATVEPALSTSRAVELALDRPGAAAIASARAAELLGGEILARGIQDQSNNVTRFLVVGETDASSTGDDKTSLAFTTHHDQPGSLVSVLHEFAARSINLTRIESRPSKTPGSSHGTVRGRGAGGRWQAHADAAHHRVISPLCVRGHRIRACLAAHRIRTDSAAILGIRDSRLTRTAVR
jgi:prephenate dehydratase